MKIENVVFDVGNVLFGYNPNKIATTLLPTDIPISEYVTNLFLADIWQSLDRGDVSGDQACEIILKNIPSLDKCNLKNLIDNFYLHLDPIYDTHNLFDSISDTHSVYVLSNFQSEPFDKLEQLYPFFQKSKGKIISAKINKIKPEPEIYKLTESTFNLTPEKTLFIDDLDANIKAAKDAGWHGIVYKNPEQLKKELKTFNVI